MKSTDESELENGFDVDITVRARWITIFESPYYPDFLAEREALHKPTLIQFRDLVSEASASADLYRSIMKFPGRERIQLCRIFRKYVSPDTSVEMLKRKNKAEELISDFGNRFRPIEDVRRQLLTRPEDDESLFAILGEYDTRGEKGYGLTTAFFEWFEAKFADEGFEIKGPVGAGADLILSSELPEYSYSTPADFVICHGGKAIVAGFARYDSDRGGSQEDDRTKGNERHATQIMEYGSDFPKNAVKVLFLNDGPGLLLGSMWDDYVRLEQIHSSNIMVSTLLMLDIRLTTKWLLGLEDARRNTDTPLFEY